MRTRKIKSLVAGGLGVLLISAAPALAVFAAEVVEDSGSTEISVTASADTMALCGWYMDGVGEEGGFNLTGEGLYIGEEYGLAKTDYGIEVYLSGSGASFDTCSTFGPAAGAELNVSWDGTGFADPVYEGLDFTLADSALVVTYLSECTSDWVTTPISLGGTYATPEIPVSISGADVDTYDPYEVGGDFPSCTFDAEYATAIPADKTPDSFGQEYNFTGPTVTTTLILQD